MPARNIGTMPAPIADRSISPWSARAKIRRRTNYRTVAIVRMSLQFVPAAGGMAASCSGFHRSGGRSGDGVARTTRALTATYRCGAAK